MEWSEAQVQIRAIEGLISEAEAEHLYRLAKDCGGTIGEIGSWKGKSTVCVALGSKKGKGTSRIFAIEPHKDYINPGVRVNVPENTEPIFRKNIEKTGVNDIVTPIVMTSEEANRQWRALIFLLWIDGDHNYEGVKKDFLLWEPFLKNGGIICFHDAFYIFANSCPGVRKVVEKETIISNKFASVHFCGRIVYATKVAKLSSSQKLLKLPKLLIWYFPPLIYSSRRFIAHLLFKVRLLKPVKKLLLKL